MNKKRITAFTLLELMIVIAIIGILVVELSPSLNTAMDRARSIGCASNLRQIGISMGSYLADNNNVYPAIESGYGASYYPAGTTNILSLGETLSSYGIGTNSPVLHCPSDRFYNNPPEYSQASNYYSSYQWLPTLDDETNPSPIVFWGRSNQARQVKLSHVRLIMDWTPIHHHTSRSNGLYADGHVKSY